MGRVSGGEELIVEGGMKVVRSGSSIPQECCQARRGGGRTARGRRTYMRLRIQEYSRESSDVYTVFEECLH